MTESAAGCVLSKKLFLEICKNSQENTCGRDSFLIKFQALACNFIKKESLAQMFSYEFYKISKNTFFTERIRTTASDICMTYAILCIASMLRKDTLPKISPETQQIKNLMFLIDVLTKYCLT